VWRYHGGYPSLYGDRATSGGTGASSFFSPSV
jgi:hypothetical protein